jgi:hypothetical protein
LNGPDNQRNSGIELIIRVADGDLSRLPEAKDLVNNPVAQSEIIVTEQGIKPDLAFG